MTKPISDLTYKILAFPEIQLTDSDEGVDWAMEMVELGHECPTLLMLAGLNKPTNHFEIIDYLKAATQELGLKLKSGDEATLSYASFYIQKIAKGKNIRENLTELYKFCQARDYEGLVYNFYLLYWAWDQLDHEDNGHNHYWEVARKSNIVKIVVDEAKKWIGENKTLCTTMAIIHCSILTKFNQ